MNSKGAGIPDNLIAFLIFSVAFIYMASSISSYISPYLEREEYGNIVLEGYTALEKIISDPSCGIVVRDHVLNYDNLVEFKANPDSYEELKKALNLKNDFVIEVASSLQTVDTLGIVDTNDTDPNNPNRIILPIGPYNHQYVVDDHVHYNLETLTIGNEDYEILVVPHVYENGSTEDEKGNRYYDRIYIDTNKNRNFQDEVDRGFYGYEDGTPISGFVTGDIFQITQAPTTIEGLRVVSIDPEGYKVYFLNRKAVDIWIGDPSMMKYFPEEKEELPTGGSAIAVFTRLVVMEENGELIEKRLIFTIRD